MESQPHKRDPSSATTAGSSTKLLFTVIAVGLLLSAGVIARQMLYQTTDESRLDRRPLPRQVFNAPFVTSHDVVVEKMVELAELTPDDVVYDLGCGDGRIVITAAFRSGCRGVGIDIDPDLVALATENAQVHGVEELVTIREQDVFELDLSECDVAMMFLTPWMVNKLVPQFEQMAPGSRIVIHNFWLEGVEPDKVAEVWVEEKKRKHGIYIYSIPLKKNPDMEIGKPPPVTNPLSPPATEALPDGASH